MSIKFGVKIMPREVILDTQGRAVEQTLKLHQKTISSCRVGKYVEIEVPIDDETAAQKQVQEIAEMVLCNPLIEKFEIQKL
jgi:phosphoribosylformylglycinamidine synthase subunit PurS